MPHNVPKLGFYYHYKHDPKGPVAHYAYEVIGVGFHTEDDARPGEEHFVMYRPLYENALVYRVSLQLGVPCFDQRPLEMWMGTVEKDGVEMRRFTPITNPEIIRELTKIRHMMYP